MKNIFLIFPLILIFFSSCRFNSDGNNNINAVCGNGKIEGDEECDTSESDFEDCSVLGFSSGKLNCTPLCKLDFSQCTGKPSSCGNNKIDPGEECDGSANIEIDCTELGYTGGTPGCTELCRFDVSSCDGYTAVCGDEIVTEDEECDGANLNSQNW